MSDVITKPPKLGRKILEKCKTLLEGSSIHAIPNIVRSEYISLKLIWFVCLLVSTSGLGWFMFQSISNYFTYPVVTNVYIHSLQQIIFPILTICNLNQFRAVENVVKYAAFSQKSLNVEEYIETVEDPLYGKCLRFNNGKSWNGTQAPYLYANGNLFTCRKISSQFKY